MQSFINAITKAYPDLQINSAVQNSIGQYNTVIIINDELVFRFPKHDESMQTLKTETAILRELQNRLSIPIPKPIYEQWQPREIGQVFIGYEMLHGEMLWGKTVRECTNKNTLQAWAKQLGTFLHELHSIPIEDFDIDLPLQDNVDTWKDMYAQIQGKLFEYMRPDARQQVTDHFENYFNALETYNFTPTLRHGDFGTVNILYEGNDITGIIDFGYAGLGDPAIDLAAIISPVGYDEDFLRRFEMVYPDIQPMLERARFYVGTFALDEALYGFDHNDQSAFDAGMATYR